MGVFSDFLEFRRRRAVKHKAADYFALLDGYRPVFNTYGGTLYEVSQTRAAINANATHRSKLQIDIVGDKYQDLRKIINIRPNPWQTTAQFLAKVSTIMDTENTCIIVPLYDSVYPDHVVGFWPVHASSAEVVEYGGEVFLRYVHNGRQHAIEYDRCGVVTRMSYKNEVFGDNNAAMWPTLQMLDIHQKSIAEAVKASATLRFLVKLSNTFSDKTIREERDRFVSQGLTDSGGVLMVDTKYADVKQIESKPVIVDKDQMALIDTNVQDYFGVSRKIIQNSYNSEEWAAYYEGNTEPFAIQLSQVLTSMLFDAGDIARGCMVYLSANRLQYASNTEKVEIVQTLFDRGLLSTNQGLDIFNMAPIGPEGDRRYIRKDYIDAALLGAEISPDLIGGNNPATPAPKATEGEGGGENAPKA